MLSQRTSTTPEVRPEALGSPAFRRAHGVRYAYVAGSMYKGIASADMVIRMGRAGLLGYLGAGGLRSERIESALTEIRRALGPDRAFGANLLCNPESPAHEDEIVSLYLAHGVRRAEAAAFVQVTPALARYRVTGLHRLPSGEVVAPNRIMAKVSRPEIAADFLSPPPEPLVRALREAGRITPDEAELARHVPMADELCAEADSGGHTDQRTALALLPDIVRLRDRTSQPSGYRRPVSVGAAGGIGTPEAVAAAFVMRADFVLTGSVNQCTVEAGTSDAAKDALTAAGTADTVVAPAGDMFEVGAKVQVLKKGSFFPARANKLYDLYRRYGSLEELERAEPRTARQLQEKFFGRSFEDVWRETHAYYARYLPAEVEKAEQNPKHKMALLFKWYFVHATRLALRGDTDSKVDFQIQCGPAMGAFNEFVRGTRHEPWRARHVDGIAELLMAGAATLLQEHLTTMTTPADPPEEAMPGPATASASASASASAQELS